MAYFPSDGPLHAAYSTSPEALLRLVAALLLVFVEQEQRTDAFRMVGHREHVASPLGRKESDHLYKHLVQLYHAMNRDIDRRRVTTSSSKLSSYMQRMAHLLG